MQRVRSTFVRPRRAGEEEQDGGGMVHGVGIDVEHGGKDGDIIGKGHVARWAQSRVRAPATLMPFPALESRPDG